MNDFLESIAPEFNGKRFSVAPPKLDAEQRHRRRFARRNERKLYKRTCDLSGQGMISFYHPDSPFTVYSHSAWWSDQWNPLDFGMDIDFNRPFFEQFVELQSKTPRIGMVINTCENSDYAPYSVRSKNLYMCVSCKESEDLKHCYQTHFSKDCIDCSLCWKLELCYECLYCTQLFDATHCIDCENGSSLYFCEECRSCNNCIGCKNLNNKQYHVFNKQVTKEEFEAYKQQLASYSVREQWRQKAEAFFQTIPTRTAHLINCDECSGDHLMSCSNAKHCFDCTDLEDCAYGFTSPGRVKDSQDFDYSPGAELCYDSMSVVDGYMSLWCLHSWENKNCFYCDECFSSKYLFGCIGIRSNEYCILNKQYTEQEYNELAPKLIEHMQHTGEWGEYFPIASAPFAYNETIAQTYYPLTKEEALAAGYQWSEYKDEVPQVDRTIPGMQLPDTTAQIPDDVLNWAITCPTSNRPFRLADSELKFYRNQNIPVPRIHPDERYTARMARSNPRVLYERQCSKCGTALQTTYDPSRPEKLLCEQCYLEEVY